MENIERSNQLLLIFKLKELIFNKESFLGQLVFLTARMKAIPKKDMLVVNKAMSELKPQIEKLNQLVNILSSDIILLVREISEMWPDLEFGDLGLKIQRAEEQEVADDQKN